MNRPGVTMQRSQQQQQQQQQQNQPMMQPQHNGHQNPQSPQQQRQDGRLGEMYMNAEDPEAKALLSQFCLNDGVIVGWGLCREGELGTGGRYNLISPFMVGGHDKAIRIGCSNMSSVWLGVRSMLVTMGSGMWGELAIGNPRFNPQVIANEENMPICPVQIVVPPVDPEDVPVDVVGGYSYFACVTRSGVVHAWGANNYCQCHYDPRNACCGLAQRRSIMNEKIVELACANYSVIARTASGSVYGWGFSRLLGPEEQLKSELAKMNVELIAVPNVEDRYIAPHPAKIQSLEGRRIVRVRGGAWHFAAIDAGGKVYTWGLGNNGRLGHGDEDDVETPKVVAALRGKRVIEVACGSFHTVFVTEAGEAFACGDNQAGQCGVPGEYLVPTPQQLQITGGRKAIHVTCGRLHTHLLLETGEVVAYGSGLGLGVGMGYGMRMVRCQPVMDNYTTFWTVGGNNHNFALTQPKQSLMFILGTPHRGVACKMRTSALREGIITCGVGSGFTLMVSRRGSLYSFGAGGWGQLGYNTNEAKDFTPDRVPVIPAATRVSYFSRSVVTYVAAGFSFSMAICEGERVYAWGNNSYGQCGLGVDPKKYQRITNPREITWLADKEILQVACGSYFALAMRNNGEVYAWGTIECCGVGLEPEESVCPKRMIMRTVASDSRGVVLSPVKIPELSCIIQIAANGWHALALNAIGEVFAWGIGAGGRLGVGHCDNCFVPTKILHNAFFTRIGCGCYTSYAIDDDARLFLWGINEKNQIGNSASLKVTSPTWVLDNVRDVALGKYFTLALTFANTFHMSGTMDFDGTAYECKNFQDTAGMPELVQPAALAQENTTGIRLFGGLEHVIVLCEKARMSTERITAATVAMRTQPEKIITSYK